MPIEAQLVTPHQQPHLMPPGGYPAAADHAPGATESAAPQILGELQQLQLKQREQLEKVRRLLLDILSPNLHLNPDARSSETDAAYAPKGGS